MKILKIISPLKQTYFAPEWDITLGVFQYEESIDSIRKFLIDLEPSIKAIPLNDQAGSGSGTDNITSRFGRYNLFDYIDQCPELEKLLTFFRLSYIDFCMTHGVAIEDIDIVCWYNILRDNAPMKEHVHSTKPNSYISGNMQFSSFETYTYYRAPQDVHGAANIPGPPGQLVMFPSYVPHGVRHNYEGTRISVAFDLHRPADSNIEPHWGCSKQFMSKEIYEQMLP